jgi:ComF family protein
MVRAASVHISPIRECIHSLKYENRPELAQPLARYLVAAFQATEWQAIAATINIVTPVPIHPERRAERGYNQAELLARHFCRATGLRLEADALRRTRHTRQQVGLNAQERLENVADAFEAARSMRGETVLLVDDVYTTGATLHSCADAARMAGARDVYALALALPTHRS